MNPRKEAVERAKEVLEGERRRLHRKLGGNRYEMKKLAEDSAVCKRELVVITDLLRALRPEKKA
jgi:hypothetical protein